jgi:ubiquinone/menaquinone biosynthesis C-methylase UbiE
VTLDFYDIELRAHHEHLRAAYGIRPPNEVLDIGCGAGLTTRESARAAAPGRVVGVDISGRMVERAQALAAAEGLDNVHFELADAQVHRFDPLRFDVAISRFGTMFFADPPAAFANIATALRPRARLVLLVWQQYEHNEWAQAIDAALGDAAQPDPDPFSLGDADATTRLLEGAGFEDVRFDDVHEPVLYGNDVDAALAFVQGFAHVGEVLAGMNDGQAAHTVERLRAMLAAHARDERGVVLGARSWLVTARRRASDLLKERVI